MSIFRKVALQGLKNNRSRTLVTVIGVMLSAALFTGVATLAVSLQRYMINGVSAKRGGWHVELPAVPSGRAQAAAEDELVQDVTAVQDLGYALLEESKNDAKPYLFVSGWDEKAFDTLPLQLLAGRLPENDGEVLVPSHLAANGGVRLAVGDTVDLALGTRVRGGETLSQHDAYSGGETLVPAVRKTYTVVGICQRPAIEEYSAPGYTLITRADGPAAGTQTVFVTLKNPYRLGAYIKGLDAYVLNNDVLRFMGLSEEKNFVVLLYAVAGVLTALVITGSVFLIYNAFNISLNERMHQFGILMSVGATAKQLRHSVLFEGACIGAVGIPLGVLAGLPAVRLVLALVEKNFANTLYDNVPLEMVVSVPALAAAALVSFATILLSAYLPARKAAAVPVMECIRQTNEIRVEAKDLRASRLERRFAGLEESLAIKNFRRNKRRYRSIILSLSFSVVLFITAGNFSGYLDQLAENSDMVVEQYDIVFSSRSMEENDLLQLYDAMKNAAHVTQSGYQAQADYPCVIRADQLSDQFLETFGPFLHVDPGAAAADAVLDVVFVDDGAYQRQLQRLGLPAAGHTGQDGEMLLAGYVEGYLYRQEEPMELTLCGADGSAAKTLRVTFVDDYPDLLPAEAGDQFRGYSLLLIAPYWAKASFDALGTAGTVTLGMTFESDNPGQSTAQLRAILDAAGVTADYTLYNVYAILEQNRNLKFIIDLFAAVFIGMITLIAVANVFNTISTNIQLRRRELAMLRSVGMAERGFNRMLCFECVLYGARTMLWSLPVSAALALLLYKGMVWGGGDMLRFQFPWAGMGLSVLGVFLIVFITMLYAAGKIKRENIIDALRDEMT